MSKLRVIYVDDEPSALKNYEFTVEHCDAFAQVSYFQNPHEAIAYVQENDIDMAFLDVDMPQMNGFALCEKLREAHPALPVAFVTGNIAYMSAKHQVVKAPYIFKPYSLRDILDVLP